DTGVWSAYFSLNGMGLDNANELLVFNFYLNGVWTDEVTAEKVAYTFLESATHVIDKPFTAPDNITKSPSYFIVSFSPRENFTYLHISKISSVDNCVFSSIYSKKFMGDWPKLENEMNRWLLKDLESVVDASRGIANLAVNQSWVEYLISNQSN
ncbi:MAG: hypothetical protein HYS88_00180, partial [Candidatus Colwellbacteria bacterium]|nr:hypothetical protein [Candidatus Colwellbacteria bacterium]